nr:golgin subfamily A member 7 isoform X2 [Halyomorpha halys]
MKAGKTLPNNSAHGDMGPPRVAQTQLCMKVFVQRDYSDGTTVKFQNFFPPELDGKLERPLFENTIGQLNAYFREAEKGTCSTYCEGCMACLTAYLMYICAQTHYEKCLRKVAKFVQEQNERVYKPKGLYLTNPVERGLRVVSFGLM